MILSKLDTWLFKEQLLELAKTHLMVNPVNLEASQDYLKQAEQTCVKLNLPLLEEIRQIKNKLIKPVYSPYSG